jgi:hypothetical protein
MIVWEDIIGIIERGRFALAIAPFEFLPEHSAGGACLKNLLTENVDAACHYFAEHRQWPEGLAVCEKRILAQRLLFGNIALRSMLKGQQTFLLNANLSPEFALEGARHTLEWLLISVWKLGGAQVMAEVEEIIFTGTNHAAMISKILHAKPEETQTQTQRANAA